MRVGRKRGAHRLSWNLQKSLAVHLEYADRRVDDPRGPSIKSKDVYLRLDWAL